MFKPQNLLLIDIETVPQYRHIDDLSPKMQQLWQHKALLLDKDCTDFAKAYAEKAGIYAEFGKIICIGLGYFTWEQNEYTLKIKCLYSDNEKEILDKLLHVCNIFFKGNNQYFCGHNIKEFDIPYICRRMYINQCEIPQILRDLQNKKPWENPLLDTLQFWKFGEYKSFVSIDLLATILDIDTPKDDISGADVAHVYWNENNLQRIAQYCNKDILTIAQILMRLNQLPILKPTQIKYIA